MATPDTSQNYSYDYNGGPEDFRIPAHELIVPSSSEGGGHYYKSNCCCYCFELCPRIDRHLLKEHKDKKTVKKILDLIGKTNGVKRKRRHYFRILRLAGNDRWNTDIRINPEKRMIPTRRIASNKGVPKTKLVQGDYQESLGHPQQETISEDSDNDDSDKINRKTSNTQLKKVCCNSCSAYLSRNYIAEHVISYYNTTTKGMSTKGALAAARAGMFACHHYATQRLRTRILCFLNEDKIGNIARYDEFIVLYGNKYSMRHTKWDQIDLVKGHMRLLARLVGTVRTLCPAIMCLEDIFRGAHWQYALEAMQILAEYDKDTERLKNAYNGHTLGMLIRRMFKIFSNYYYRNENEERLKLLKSFRKAFEDEYLPFIGSKATDADNRARRLRALKPLPSTEDIKIFKEFLEIERKKLYTYFRAGNFDLESYMRFLNIVVILIQLFNRRRPCETERAEVLDFEHARTADFNDEYF